MNTINLEVTVNTLFWELWNRRNNIIFNGNKGRIEYFIKCITACYNSRRSSHPNTRDFNFCYMNKGRITIGFLIVFIILPAKYFDFNANCMTKNCRSKLPSSS